MDHSTDRNPELVSCFLDQLTKACVDANETKADKLHKILENALQSVHNWFPSVWLELCVSSMIRVLSSHPERCTKYLALVLTANNTDKFLPVFSSSLKSKLLSQGEGCLYYYWFVQLLDGYETAQLDIRKKEELDTKSYLSSITAEDLFWISMSENFKSDAANLNLERSDYTEKVPWEAISIFAEQGEEEMLYELLLYYLENKEEDILSLHLMDKLFLGFCAAEFSETFSRVLHRIYHENKAILWLSLEQVAHLPPVVERVAYHSLSSDNFHYVQQHLKQLEATFMREDSSLTLEKAIEQLNNISTPVLDCLLHECKISLESIPLETLYLIMYYCHALIMKTENTTLLFRLSITYSCIVIFTESISGWEGVYDILVADLCKGIVLRRLSKDAFFTILVPFRLSQLCCTKLWKHSVFGSCISLLSNDGY